MLVWHRLAVAHTGIGRHHHLRFGIVDTGGQRAGGETAEYHRVDSADTHRRQHGEDRFRNHRHVNQDTVAFLDILALQDGGHALDFALQFGPGVNTFFVGFGRNVNQRTIIRTLGSVTIHRVVAEVSLTVHEPFDEGWTRKITDLGERLFPLDQLCLLGPEIIAVFDGTLMKILILAHSSSASSGLLVTMQ